MRQNTPLPVRIVLVETSHPGNIGSTARAMKTMLLDDLVLVSPVMPPDNKAIAMAAGADDILETAQTVETVGEAVADCQWIVGATARPRGMEMPEDGPREGVSRILAQAKSGNKVALVFGRERTGLTNAEIEHCHRLIRIPSNPDYSSLNLSQAVQVLSYELRMQLLEAVQASAEPQQRLENVHPDHLPANQAQLENLYDHWHEVFRAHGFLHAENAIRLMRFVKVMISRGQPTVQEINVLRGMLSSIAAYRGTHIETYSDNDDADDR